MGEDRTLLALEHRVSTLEEEIKRNSSAHREFYARLQITEQSHAVAQERHQQIITRFDTISKKLEEISSVPVKKWYGLSDKVLYAVVGIFVAYLFSKLGM